MELQFKNYSGTVGVNKFSDYDFDLETNKFKGMIVGPEGCIFEMKYPASVIMGTAQ